MELPEIETDALPGLLRPELAIRSDSVQFSTARYLRFRSRALTASRAVTYRRELPASYVPGGRVIRSGRGHRSVADLGWPRPSLRPEGRRGPPPAGDHACLFLFHQLRRKHVSPRAMSWGTREVHRPARRCCDGKGKITGHSARSGGHTARRLPCCHWTIRP